MNDRTVTVFGGTGFLGRRVVRHLRESGFPVRIASRHPERGNTLFGCDDPQLQSVKADIHNERSIAAALVGAYGAVNAVSLYVEHGQETFHSVHVEAAQRVATQAHGAGVERLVHVSGIGSDAASPSLYIRKRGEGELATRAAFADAALIRPAVMFGPDDAFLTIIIKLLRRLPIYPMFGRGLTRLQPAYVEDVAEAIARVLQVTETRAITYECGGPGVYSYREFLRVPLRATYTSTKPTRGDVENVLFYNVGPSVFSKIARDVLRFEKRNSSIPAPPDSSLNAQHCVRYDVEPSTTNFSYVQHEPSAECEPVTCKDRDDLKKPARLWWLFKRAIGCSAGGAWSAGNPFSVQLTISASAKERVNLADVVKPLMDAFISALHCYEGEQLNAVADRLAQRLDRPPREVRNLLTRADNASLGSKRVLHLRGEGLQWSPADDFLCAGELVRETVENDGPIVISGRLFIPSV